MRLCKRLIVLLVIMALSSSLVFAHPGRTDSNGGHTDSNTGIYHYHHGYPEHQHTGGVCPYNFDDKTGWNSGASSGRTQTEKDTVKSTSSYMSTIKDKGGLEEVPPWVYWTITILSLAVILLALFIINRNKKIGRVEKEIWERNKEIETLRTETRTLLKQLNQKNSEVQELQEHNNELNNRVPTMRCCISDLIGIIERIQKKPIQDFDISDESKQEIDSVLSIEGNNISNIEIPDDVYFIDGFIPVSGRTSAFKPFGDFTVYIAPFGKCYHSNPKCGSGNLNPAHAYEVIEFKSPCINCAKSFPQVTPLWYRQIKTIRNNM